MAGIQTRDARTPLCIVEERQTALAAAPLGAAARRLRCSLLTYRTGMLVARALPADLEACSKVQMLFCGRPLRSGCVDKPVKRVAR